MNDGGRITLAVDRKSLRRLQVVEVQLNKPGDFA